MKILHLLCVVALFATYVFGRNVQITKCCPENQVIDATLIKCRDSGDVKWTPQYFTDTENEHGDSEESKGIEGYDIVSKIPQCPGTGVHIIPLRDIEEHSIFAAKFRLLKSGKIVAKHSNGHWIAVPGDSCVDGLQNFENSGDLYSGSKIDQALITCPLLEENIL